jgi:hypothetical protein
MKNHFFILCLVLTTISNFACKEKNLSDEEFEKIQLTIIKAFSSDSLNYANDKVIIVPNFSKSSRGVKPNNLGWFDCGTSQIQYQIPTITRAHDVTGGNPPLRIASAEVEGGDLNCAYINDTMFVEAKLEISVPCDSIFKLTSMEFISKFFEDSLDISDSITNVFYYGYTSKKDKKIVGRSILSNNTIDPNHFVICPDGKNCQIHVYAVSHFIPKFKNLNKAKTYSFAFQIRDQDIIPHSESTTKHNHASDLNYFEKKVLSLNPSFNMFTHHQIVTLYENLCKKVPVTLDEFKFVNNVNICNHMAEHTFVTSVPICIKPQTANNDPGQK